MNIWYKTIKIINFALFLSCFLSINVFAQSPFKLTGEIKNPTERKVLITLYRDWVGDEEEYEIILDQNNKFSFVTDLSKIAYVDFYYADKGFHYWIIEPKDEINLVFDNKDFWHTFNVKGFGSEKWLYYNQEYHRFEERRDLEKEIAKWQKLAFEDYFKQLDEEQTRQIEFLKESKGYSNDFFELRKADIVGAIQNHKIEHLFAEKYNNWSETQVKTQLKFDSIPGEKQGLSLEFGNTYLNLIELFSSKSAESKKRELTEKESYDLIFSLFARSQISRELAERILANYLKNTIDLGGMNEKMKSLVTKYLDFSENRAYKNYLSQKLDFLKTMSAGSPAKPFTLKDFDGNTVTLSSLKGKVVYLDFWASWCGPCIYDMKFMENVKTHFKDRDDLIFVYISLDTEQEWKEAVVQYEVKGINLRADEGSQMPKSYGVNGIPAYFLIDKNGNFAVSQVADPSMEEGKELIKQIEGILK